MLADLKYALRQLRKSPGFAITAIITLALGIGATTAIFTLVQQVMLKSLPVTRPDELYRVGSKIRCCNWGGYLQDGEFSLFSWDLYKRFRDNTHGFSELAALPGNAPLGVRRAGSSQPAQTFNGEFVSGNFFHTFGISAWIGRTLKDSDDQEGAPSVAVMSYHVWQEKFGGDPSVVGATYEFNGNPFTVVGVTPPGFYGAKLSGWGMPDFWMPLAAELLIDGKTARLKSVNSNWLDLIGRIRPGANPKIIESQLRVELQQWLTSHVPDMNASERDEYKKQTLYLTPGGAGVADMRDQYHDGLELLLAAAACVLLIACANLANLLLARGLKNKQQTSVRVALGASRQRLVRKALIESLTLGILGGLFGLAVSVAGSRLILHLAFRGGGPNTYIPIQATPSWPVLLFALAVSILTGILFGIAPAWITSHAEPVDALRGASRTVGGKASWSQKTLVIAQAALSLVLLSAAAMLGQSLRNLEHQDFGFQPKGRYIAWINPMLGNYKLEQLQPMFEQIQERMRSIPGVRAASAALYAPMSGDSWNDGVRVEGKPEPRGDEDDSAGWTRVTPNFFETIGDPMVSGRPITEEDTATTRHVAVINQAFAKRFFPGENPLGRHFGPDEMKYAADFEVVGVASDARFQTYELKKAIRPMYFLPESQSTNFDKPNEQSGELWSHYLYNIVLWAPGNPAGLEAQVRKALSDVDPNLVLYAVDPYSEVLGTDFEQEDMISTLTLLFGALALVLAAVGLYGVTAYTVEQRTSEIGIRMALGADRRSVISMVLRGAFSQVGLGLIIGIPAAIGAGWAMATQLFGVKSYDPLMLAAAILLLSLAALIAALIPAQKASSVDPMKALRTE
jgi:putative ABC transport system permease protein